MTGTDDLKIIEGVIQSYLDGLYEGDASKIAGVFHPTSALTSVTSDGELEVTPRDKWLDKVRARQSPKQQGLPRHDTGRMARWALSIPVQRPDRVLNTRRAAGRSR